MSETGPVLDPEVEAILREIARDPDSVLLRVDRPKALRALARGEELTVRGTVGLSKAEKHLLEVHRDEAAYLLRLAYYERAERATLDRDGGVIVRGVESTVRPVGEKAIAEQLRRERSALAGDQESTRVIDQGLRVLAFPRCSLIDLPVASMRLAHSMAARCYIGIESRIAGDLQYAMRVFLDLLEEPMTRTRRARYLIHLAHCLGSMGRYDEAQQRTRESVEIIPGYTDAALSWLASSIQIGHEDQAREAIRCVDQNLAARSSWVTNWISATSKQKTRGIWTLTSGATPLMKRLIEHTGEASRGVLDMMLNEDRVR